MKSKKLMEHALLKHIDQLIEKYRKDHKGELPLYIVLSPEETESAREAIRSDLKESKDHVITTYRDIKLAEHPALLNGNSYVSNELPETGS